MRNLGKKRYLLGFVKWDCIDKNYIILNPVNFTKIKDKMRRQNKKILVGLVIAFALVGCGDKVEITPKEEKIKIVNEYFEEKNKKYEEITAKLQVLADKGNEKAEKELERWDEIRAEISAKNMFKIDEKTKKEVEEMRKAGRLW